MGLVAITLPESLHELLRRHKGSNFIARPELRSGTHNTLFALGCFSCGRWIYARAGFELDSGQILWKFLNL